MKEGYYTVCMLRRCSDFTAEQDANGRKLGPLNHAPLKGTISSAFIGKYIASVKLDKSVNDMGLYFMMTFNVGLLQSNSYTGS